MVNITSFLRISVFELVIYHATIQIETLKIIPTMNLKMDHALSEVMRKEIRKSRRKRKLKMVIKKGVKKRN